VSSKNSGLTKYEIWQPFLLSVILSFGIFAGARLNSGNTNFALINQIGSEVTVTQGKVEEIIRYIDLKYVDKVNKDELTTAAINTILSQLDPHSSYIPPAKYIEVKEQLQGNFVGIGADLMLHRDSLFVVSVIEGGPADKGGLKIGDRITAIDDSVCIGHDASLERISSLLRGPKGSTIEISLQRYDKPAEETVNITRDIIEIKNVEAAIMLDSSTAYIKIAAFSSNTYKEFMENLEALVVKQHAKNFIIDLRGNPGGYVQEAANILNQFFDEKGKLLVYTEGRNSKRNEYRTTNKPFFDIGKIAILTDEMTASASEIVAGAIQDWDRGVIVGRRTFGKGLVQDQFPLSNGAAIRLTVARYYTPSGRLIQREYKNNLQYEDVFSYRLHNGELFSPDSIHQADSMRFYTANGRVVHDKGGITPDVFVPLDTIEINPRYKTAVRNIPHFIMDYYLSNNGRLKMELDSLRDDKTIAPELYNSFVSYLRNKGVDLENTKRIRKPIEIELKSELAKILFYNKGLYTVKATEDAAIRKALEALKSPNYPNGL